MAAEYKLEMFHMFLQKSILLLSDNGNHGFILPATILNNVYAEPLRNFVGEHCCISYISVANKRIFEDADVHTTVLILKRQKENEKRQKNIIFTTHQLNEQFVLYPQKYSQIIQERFSKLPGKNWNILIDENNIDVIQKIISRSVNLGELSKINRGLITGNREKYFSPRRLNDKYIPIIAGADVHRYEVKNFTEYVLFERPNKAGGSWDPAVHLADHKIVVRQIGVSPMACLIEEPMAVTGNLFTVRTGQINSEKYILGIINSRIIDFFWHIMFTDFKSSFPQVTAFSLAQIPIPESNNDKKDRMIAMVERMLSLHQQLASSNTPTEKTLLQRQIDTTDHQIDALGYDLYGLTDEEIKLVEGR